MKSFEEFVPYAEATGSCVPIGQVGVPALRVTMQLASLPVPSVASTWGRIKTLYR